MNTASSRNKTGSKEPAQADGETDTGSRRQSRTQTDLVDETCVSQWEEIAFSHIPHQNNFELARATNPDRCHSGRRIEKMLWRIPEESLSVDSFRTSEVVNNSRGHQNNVLESHQLPMDTAHHNGICPRDEFGQMCDYFTRTCAVFEGRGGGGNNCYRH